MKAVCSLCGKTATNCKKWFSRVQDEWLYICPECKDMAIDFIAVSKLSEWRIRTNKH